MNRTLKELVENDDKVYVYLANSEIGNQFMQQAESEGFIFTDGTNPTGRRCAEIMAVNSDITINFVGINGRIAFGSGVEKVGNQRLIRVDYGKYVNGESDYFYK